MVVYSKSPSETIRIGKAIGSYLQAGDVVALIGELGAGKTQLIKGLAEGTGVKNSAYVSSPSFTLINEYKGKTPFYHIDLYRLGEEKEAEGLGLEEYFQGDGITAVEWADRILSLLPKEFLRIHIHYTGKNTRSIEIVGKGMRFLNLVNQIQSSELGVRSSE
ncbi:MAG: tRNA (adenosine(37)-N6)-threonylcarbamoyltransferase complex ATPase subunit type 1 TsaE [Deltaproteobacteria bacterium]|nr:tRNA (adenosine(37)-N6)-threonylcarbamoyltransferase complex ATPase subunit type 1 TsaE [Deltaproteobacteria bacterium]MBM4322037.1 tRNA (adenosine(37)-N6)-threonylcarbamoyltransferase complex ATPase subunit type 1 TsaE [Deltaproteobacteria bacterium]